MGHIKDFGILVKELQKAFSDFSYLGLGCSGGLDSMVLAEALLEAKIPFRILHFNHGWRGRQSDLDRDFVRKWSRARKISFTTKKWSRPKKTEEAAREARLCFFHDCAQRYQLQGILLAHHQNDLAETFLINLLRGTGPNGLASLKPVNQVQDLTLHRPLLNYSRDDILNFAHIKAVDWREDSSNKDLKFTRNRVRHQLLPELESLFGRAPTPLLARTAQILMEENDFWETNFSASSVNLSVHELRNLHPAAQRRKILSWLTSQTGTSPDFEEIESVRNLVLFNSPAKVNLKRGRHCRRKQGRLFIED